MTPDQAKAKVIAYLAKNKVNKTDLAKSVGASKQSLDHWLSGEHFPREPRIWLDLAQNLGLNSPQKDEIYRNALDLAIAVLARDQEKAEQLALAVMKEITQKFMAQS